MISGTIFNIQRFSIHDGPGIRTTIFFKGCNLSCFWCHNPESIDPEPEIQYFDQKCIGCGKCIEVCPVNAHKYSLDRSGRIVFDRELCIKCGRCAEACCTGALELCGKKMSVREAADEAEKDKAFYDNSGGGVTLSGGEPLLQAEFAAALLEECKKRGMHTAVDTAGSVPWESFERVMPFTDLFLYDIKAADTNKHKVVTGSGNELIIENLMKLSEAADHTNITIRIPVVPGVNDTEEEMRDIASIIDRSGRILPVKLQPYHKFGKGKYKSLGLDYKAENIEPPSADKMKMLNQVFAGSHIH